MEDVRANLRGEVVRLSCMWATGKKQLIEVFEEYQKDVEDFRYWEDEQGALCFDVYGKQSEQLKKSDEYYINYVHIWFSGRFVISGAKCSCHRVHHDDCGGSELRTNVEFPWSEFYSDVHSSIECVTFLVARELSRPDYDKYRRCDNPKMNV